MLTERSREIPFLLNHAIGARDMLDIGSAGSKYLASLSQVVHNLTCIDTRDYEVPYGVTGLIGDATHLPEDWTGRFDCVSCISVLDHVGLDAYGNNADPEALGRVVSEMARVTKRGGKLIVTAPVGRPQLTIHPNGGQRVFDPDELYDLFVDKDWRLKYYEGWALVNYDDGIEEYKQCNIVAWLSNSEYGGNRANACLCAELIRL